MKQFLALMFLISTVTHAQFSIKGSLTAGLDTNWVVLYRNESSKQQFVQNTTIKKENLFMSANDQTNGTFEFELPADTKIGSYSIKYRTSGASFLHFIFNKENVSFSFHPDFPKQTVLFSRSKENIMYENYLTEITEQQQKLDSLQISSINNTELDLNLSYKITLAEIHNIQKKYLESSKEMYIQPFVKASLRVNPLEIETNLKEYMSHERTTFFNNINFSNTSLINSSFLLDKITDYIFYLKDSEDIKTHYKSAVKTVFSKIKDPVFKKNIIEFLIEKFEESNTLTMIDFLFENYYNTLPKSLQSTSFKREKLRLLATAVGRIAPDFSWKENGKDFQLSTLNEANYYVLIFWSSTCSHCLREIPELHTFLKGNTKVKVIAFAMENNRLDFNRYQKVLCGWHNVLGIGKWENKTALNYNIRATPSYFVLDATKKIIAKPIPLEELKGFINKL